MDKQLTITKRRTRHSGSEAKMSGVTKTIQKPVIPEHGSRIRALKERSKGKRNRSQLTF